MKKLLLILSLSLAMLPLLAQLNMMRPNFSPYALKSALPNLKMSHSMGFEAGTSSGGDGYYLSRYTNTLSYKLSPKMDLDVDLNFVNFGSTSKGFSLNDDNSTKLLPEFSLRYQPRENMSFELRMRQGWMNRSVITDW
ncbi:MAG: hypothetical protein PHT47_03215 [Candidatus Cloacimonetes bacterium]|jgi:hypothetical protein|nr:hypothetical protein [Candidatus Cloacimonadota bacterium]MDD4100078.1 hypothetical protein [Candidatus Cloacimonadota bacterium]MDD4805177.1 hypothetical protein [Candidatus Cloacimonadota bacterium]